jgi:hypothetical protein
MFLSLSLSARTGGIFGKDLQPRQVDLTNFAPFLKISVKGSCISPESELFTYDGDTL